MTNSGKMLFSLFMIVIIVSYIALRIDTDNIAQSRESYADSIQSASQLAALNLLDTVDVNSTYDGARRDSNDISIDFGTLGTFRENLMRLLKSNRTASLTGVSNMNVPMIGYITYDYVLGVTYGQPADTASDLNLSNTNYDKFETEMNKGDRDKITSITSGKFLLPSGYTYYMQNSMTGLDAELKGKTWRFTLGNIVYVTDTKQGLLANGEYKSDIKYRVLTESKSGKTLYELVELDKNSNLYDDTSKKYDITNFLDRYGFKTFDALRDFVVMTSINSYVNTYMGSGFSLVADNASSSLRLDLSTNSYSGEGLSGNVNSNVISGPGVFAIVDIYKGSMGENRLYERVASFGGSELVSNRK